ncbi:hypothetical protein BKA70DRAFT_1221641 [Coprinopsis sp. MPI-PUGE-AT-0042]|nr:hypothetical protein BKA70DRAFT_1221641 [Coprinopsis sp. MPI-PUGE-AT-0042]
MDEDSSFIPAPKSDAKSKSKKKHPLQSCSNTLGKYLADHIDGWAHKQTNTKWKLLSKGNKLHIEKNNTYAINIYHCFYIVSKVGRNHLKRERLMKKLTKNKGGINYSQQKMTAITSIWPFFVLIHCYCKLLDYKLLRANDQLMKTTLFYTLCMKDNPTEQKKCLVLHEPTKLVFGKLKMKAIQAQSELSLCQKRSKLVNVNVKAKLFKNSKRKAPKSDAESGAPAPKKA